MGNNPSSTARPSSSSPSQSQGGHGGGRDTESPRPGRQPAKNLLPNPNQQGPAAPPERSLAHAKGTPVQPAQSNNPRLNLKTTLQPGQSLSNSPAPSTPTGSTTSSTRPVEVKQQARSAHLYEAAHSRPVAVPNPHDSPSSPRSPFSADSIESGALQHSSVQDMSYLTRPPRLPLPIEEEVHTPGSPLIAPADIGQPIDDVDALDVDGLPRQTSNLSSNSTIDDEDAEELRVDKTRPTVPTRLEWLRGGDKVYVTGTIFQWNRKTRLHPV
jgi:hypothetical protein